jgi:Outer membrane protein beta-barrel domain
VKRARTLGVLLLLSDVAGASAATRARPGPPPAAHAPDVFAGYSYLRAGEAGLHGADVSASFPGWRRTRWMGDFSLHTGSFAGADLDQAIFMAGLRRVFREPDRARPFVQVLLGGAHAKSTFADVQSSATSWGGALGIGADLRLSDRWAVRGQADYFLLHSSAGWDGDPRFSIGLAYRFLR